MTQDRASGRVCASLPRDRRASQHPASDYTLNREEPIAVRVVAELGQDPSGRDQPKAGMAAHHLGIPMGGERPGERGLGSTESNNATPLK